MSTLNQLLIAEATEYEFKSDVEIKRPPIIKSETNLYLRLLR
jgi:hypothetical protein